MADRSGYIGRAPGDSSVIIARKSYEPTGVQTDFTFNSGYTPGYCDVYLNGVKLIDEKDFTASNGSTVGLTSAAQSGDIVELVVYKAYNLGVPLADVTGNLDITGYVSASSSITAGGAFYGDGSNLSNIAGVAVTQYIAANSLTVIGSPGVSTITRLGVTDAVVTGIITANGLSGNVTGAAITITGNATFNSNVTIGGTLTYEDVTNVDALGIVTARAGVNVSGGELKVGSAVTVSGVGVATFVGAAGVAVTITPSTGKVQATTFEGPLTGNVTGGITAPSGASVTFADDINIASSDIVWDASANLLQFNDDIKATFGNSGVDLTIYHTNTGQVDRIDSGNKLEIRANASIDLSNEDGSSTYAFFNEAGSSDIYYANSKKFETTNDGTVTTGIATATGGLEINADNKKLQIGASADLQLYHDGTDSIISNSTNVLKIHSSHLFIRNAAGNEDIAKFTQDGAVQLYHNGTEKLATAQYAVSIKDALQVQMPDDYWSTASTFLDVAGYGNLGSHGAYEVTLTAGGYRKTVGGSSTWEDITVNGESGYGVQIALNPTNGNIIFRTESGMSSGDATTITERLRIHDTGEVQIPDNGKLTCGAANDLELFHDGSNSVIDDTGTGSLVLRSDTNIKLLKRTGDENMVVATPDGAVSLYYDNSVKLGTSTQGISVTGNIDLSSELNFGTANHKYIDFYTKASDNTTYSAHLRLVNHDSSSFHTAVGMARDGAVDLYYSGTKKFETTNDGAVITGITTVTQGLNTDGLLSEKFNTTAGKLSDNTNIDLEDGMVHYFSTQETTTSTPNIRYSSSKSLNNMLSTGDAISITVITTAAAGGYSANWTVDGSAVTEDWVGGSAPSAGGSDGLDIYGITILKTGSGAYKFIGNLTNAT